MAGEPESTGLSKEIYEDCELGPLSLVEARIEGVEFHGVTIRDSDLSKAQLVKCRFEDCRFVQCRLSMVRPVDTVFHETTFTESKALGVDFGLASGKMPSELRFESSDVSFASFVDLDLRELLLEDCIAREADFTGANLTGARFARTDLVGARFSGANLERADFRTARNYFFDPREVRLKGTRLSMPEAANLLQAFDVDIE